MHRNGKPTADQLPSVDEYVANILASAPPLTTDTISRITSILQVVSND